MPTDLFISMARRYYKRRTVVVRPRKRWATNFKQGEISGTTDVLVSNASPTSSPTPVILKVGNFKIQGDLTYHFNLEGSSVAPRVTVVVFYLPQGIEPGASTANGILTSHPEWILAWKQLDCSGSATPGTVYGNSFSMSSRLKRNLNSGDRVCIGSVSDIGTVTPDIKYSCQFWTSAN